MKKVNKFDSTLIHHCVAVGILFNILQLFELPGEYCASVTNNLTIHFNTTLTEKRRMAAWYVKSLKDLYCKNLSQLPCPNSWTTMT